MAALSELDERGFVVIPGPVPPDRMERLISAFTTAVASATDDDIRVGSTTTRVSDFVNRGSEFDDLYVFPPLLEACRRVIGGPFKLSSLHARTVRPHMPAQELHVDVRRDSGDWPLVGFILMVDPFRADNGATRFVPGSHRWSGVPEDALADVRGEHEGQVLACGQAGSLLYWGLTLSIFSAIVAFQQRRTPGMRRTLCGVSVDTDRPLAVSPTYERLTQ